MDGQTRLSITFITQTRQVADTVSEVLAGSDATCEILSEAPDGRTYDVIIAQPAIGGGPDGFGSKAITALLARLREKGTLLWLTRRAFVRSKQSTGILDELKKLGVSMAGTVELPSGFILGSNMPGVLLILSRQAREERFVATIQSSTDGKGVSEAFLQGPTRRKIGAGWRWLNFGDNRDYSDLEREAALARIAPKGRYDMMPLRSLLSNEEVRSANTVTDSSEGDLFIPEYASSSVTDRLELQTVKPKAVYHLNIDTTKAIPRFLVGVLNSQYGRMIRENSAGGVTIPRVSKTALLQLMIPVPDTRLQAQISDTDSDIQLLRSALDELSADAERNWKNIPEIIRTVDQFKSVIDIDRRIADWWRELPYPLASLYRRYQAHMGAKEKLEVLFHFFEMTAIYLALIGCSHIRSLTPDWQAKLGAWLHPARGAGIELADFGFWIGLAVASLKEASRVYSSPDERSIAAEMAGAELANSASEIGSLGRTADALNDARKYRNSWKGHGGHMKSSDADRILAALQSSVARLYEIAGPIFRRMYLVRAGAANIGDDGVTYKCEILTGSDPVFVQRTISLDRPSVKTGALAFWISESRVMCPALPFLRMGAPQEPQENCIYAFNRLDKGCIRWISYQEARE